MGVVTGALTFGAVMAMSPVVALTTMFSSLTIWALYSFILEGWKGQTFGKWLTGVIVVKEDGSPCDFMASFVRNLLRLIDGLFLYLVGLLFMAFSDRRQRLGDRLAGTVVVRVKGR